MHQKRFNASLNVFYAYAPEDGKLRDELEKHLSILQRKRLIAGWHDRQIVPGTDFVQAIDQHLTRAAIILLLISSDFLASDYCYGLEMQWAMKQHLVGSALVIPLLMRPVDKEYAPFAHLQCLPRNGKPVTSWENQDEAFAEIVKDLRIVIAYLHNHTQSGITFSTQESPISDNLKQSQHILNFPHAFPPVWNIPYRQNPFFMYREQTLESLHRTFHAHHSPISMPIVAITGPGGVGKTQLATEYAFRYRENYVEAVMWVRADSRETLVADLVALAGTALLNVAVEDMLDQRRMLLAVQWWWREHANWLLIFDNADDLALVSEFLPQVGRGHILLTTRALATGDLAQGIELEPLDPRVGALFLLYRTKLVGRDVQLQDIPEERRSKAQMISECMGGLPLALDQAGAYIEETACGVQGYLDLYAPYRSLLLQERGGPAPEYKIPVAMAWTFSMRYVQKVHPGAADLLQLSAFLYPDSIPEAILLQGAPALGSVLQPVASDPFLLNTALKVLRAFSLLDRNAEEHTFTIHRLIQATLEDQMDLSTRHLWAERAVHAVYRAFVQITDNRRRSYQQLIPQVQRCFLLIKQWNMVFHEAAELLHQTGAYLHLQGQYQQAENLYRQAFTIYQQTLPENHPDFLLLQERYTSLQNRQGNTASQGMKGLDQHDTDPPPAKPSLSS